MVSMGGAMAVPVSTMFAVSGDGRDRCLWLTPPSTKAYGATFLFRTHNYEWMDSCFGGL